MPVIISMFITGMITNNVLIGGRVRDEVWTPDPKRVALYCTWRPSAVTLWPLSYMGKSRRSSIQILTGPDVAQRCWLRRTRCHYATPPSEQGVALTGRNRTGPPCSVGHPITTRPAASAPTVHAPGGRPARTPAALQTTATDDDSQQNNTGPLGGPIINRQSSV